MSIDVHTASINPAGSPPAQGDRVLVGFFRDQPFPASAAALTTLGSITAGTGYDVLPTLAPSGGTLTSGVTQADPAVAVATSLKCVTATVATAGAGVAINDTFVLAGGTIAPSGAYGVGGTSVPVATTLTVTNAQLVSTLLNNAGSGYAAGDTITTAGGTAGTHAIITVDSVNAGAIVTFHVSTPGNYTVEAAALTQGSTSGSGTGATFQTSSYGALTFSITAAGGYTVAPPTPNTPTNGTGTGTGVTATVAFGLGTALLVHSGNYSAAPSFTVTAADGNGSGASIASGTLGGNGNAIPRRVVGDFPSAYSVQVTLNGAGAFAETVQKTNTFCSFAVVPASGATLSAGTADVLTLG